MMRTRKKADGASLVDFDQGVFNRKLILQYNHSYDDDDGDDVDDEDDVDDDDDDDLAKCFMESGGVNAPTVGEHCSTSTPYDRDSDENVSHKMRKSNKIMMRMFHII